MASQERDTRVCQQCGETLASDLRYCVHCYAPVGGSASRAHVELARKTATTHRPDPTVVFSPEKHAAIVRRSRSRKRLIITSSILLVVLAAGSIAVNIINRNQRQAQKAVAREQSARRELKLLADALERFRGDMTRYPTNEEGLRCLARKPASFEAAAAAQMNYWFGPYLEYVPEVDPWGNDYVYHTADGGRSFELFSPGPGGAETGSESRFRVGSQAPIAN